MSHAAKLRKREARLGVSPAFIARDLGFLSSNNFNLLLSKIDEISRMMIAFQKKLKADG